MKKHFYIFRHGQTQWNVDGRAQGQSPYPIPLTQEGCEQAQKLGEKLSGKNIGVIYSSDLHRAMQTSEIIGKILGISVVEDKRLREVNYGRLNGLYPLEMAEVYPNYRQCYEDFSCPFPDGESLNQVVERFNQAIEEIVQKSPYEKVGISTHGHIIMAFLSSLFRGEDSHINNGEYVHLMYDSNETVKKFTKLQN